jgi:hypothetical protein
VIVDARRRNVGMLKPLLHLGSWSAVSVMGYHDPEALLLIKSVINTKSALLAGVLVAAKPSPRMLPKCLMTTPIPFSNATCRWRGGTPFSQFGTEGSCGQPSLGDRHVYPQLQQCDRGRGAGNRQSDAMVGDCITRRGLPGGGAGSAPGEDDAVEHVKQDRSQRRPRHRSDPAYRLVAATRAVRFMA